MAARSPLHCAQCLLALVAGRSVLSLASWLPSVFHTESETAETGGRRQLIRRAPVADATWGIEPGIMSLVAQGDWSEEGNIGSTGIRKHCDERWAGNSMPGTPNVNELSIELRHFNATISLLGDRVLKALDASDAMKSCGSFFSFGDYTWCNKVMPGESEFATRNLYAGNNCKVSGTTNDSALQLGDSVREVNNGAIEGLSYGIEGSDSWSELMSNMYFLNTRLFDCYVQKASGGPMFTDMHGKRSRADPCTSRGCYTVPYEVNHKCLADKSRDEDGWKFESLSDSLNGRQPMSTLVKMNVQGMEWPVLESLLQDEDELAKIRTLDLEVHMTAGSHGMPLDRRVAILERLAKEFAVVGSTVQSKAKATRQDFERDRQVDPDFRMEAPGVYSSAGMPLIDFAVSLVNRHLL